MRLCLIQTVKLFLITGLTGVFSLETNFKYHTRRKECCIQLMSKWLFLILFKLEVEFTHPSFNYQIIRNNKLTRQEGHTKYQLILISYLLALIASGREEMSSNKGYCFLKQSEFGANCVSGFQELR